ncbi:hypothetical protein BY458DRAFT_448427 [Sporodiniella umbellata]|nr:hypothetical protein BY458DRAFT_448427 [Sporodiniella umbellata]
MEVDKESNNNIYEVQNIIKHRGSNSSLEFLVKWRGFKKKKNSWVSHTDFIEKDIIKEYFASIT